MGWEHGSLLGRAALSSNPLVPPKEKRQDRFMAEITNLSISWVLKHQLAYFFTIIKN
jgi:hypothetical protein